MLQTSSSSALSNQKKTLDPILALNVNVSSRDGNKSAPPSCPEEEDSSSLPPPAISWSTITSLCFLPTAQKTTTTIAELVSHARAQNLDDDCDLERVENDEDEDEESDLRFRCHQLVRNEKTNDADPTAHAREVAASLSLKGYILGTCHADGENYLWDLGQRKIIGQIATNRGPGMMIRRIQQDDKNDNSRFFYQTRDLEGTISLHDTNITTSASLCATENHTVTKPLPPPPPPPISEYQTYSQSFCTAAPCCGNPNLIAMPSREMSFATVRDWRVPPDHSPVALFHGVEGVSIGSSSSVGGENDDLLPTTLPATVDRLRKHGMLMSLAMTTEINSGKTVVACGMESGTVVFHDLAMMNEPVAFKKDIRPKSSIAMSLAKEAVLSLDVSPSSSKKQPVQRDPTSSNTSTSSSRASFVAIAGLAGDADDLVDLPESERGRVALVKATLNQNGMWEPPRLRARLSTCSMSAPSGGSVGRTAGQPGVGQCRFRPGDGRIFAVGGWDKRVRIFDRAAAPRPLAILRGHTERVQAIDWSPDAAKSGLLASGSSDGWVNIWRCFPSL